MNLQIIVGAIVVSLCSQGSSYAQIEKPRKAPPTRIAVVNIRVVFQKYWRAQGLKQELELDLLSYKEKAKKLSDEIKECELELFGSKDQQKAKVCRQRIEENKRRLNELCDEVSRVVGKRQEDNLAVLWPEVNMGIKAVAEAYGFQIVLGYDEPEKVEFPPASRNRKQVALDQGALPVFFVHRNVDITDLVLSTINRRPVRHEDVRKKLSEETEAPK